MSIPLKQESIEESVVSPAGAVYQELLSSFRRDGLEARHAEAQRLMQELGVTFQLYDETGRDHVVPLDLFPRVLAADEWTALAHGLAQRLAIWNAFLKDLYDSQEALKAGIVPFELVYGDPRFLRGAVGVKVLRDIFVHVAAFDLARDAEGRWMVINDHISRPTGASYALHARGLLSQLQPDILSRANIVPNSGFPGELLEHLRNFQPPSAAEPRVVILTGEAYSPAYFEDSILARQMGIPLVRGGDLIVLNGRAFYKTIAGLECIDVIYRRMDDARIDPLALAVDDPAGVPGLLTCVRKGTVTIANAVGSGLGASRALAAYLPKLARFYSAEKLMLPSVPRLLCFDPDQRRQVLAHLEEYIVITGKRTFTPSQMSAAQADELRAAINANPADYIAEPFVPLDLLPSSGAMMELRHAGLRMFAMHGRKLPAFPCALTRVALDENSRVISSGRGGAIADTWILRGAAGHEPAPTSTLASSARRLPLGSRVAENLFWLGRYAERAENTARIFRTLHALQIEDRLQESSHAWAPLWEALARATGHPTHFFRKRHARKQSIAEYVVSDTRNPGSIASCLARCRDNAHATRESVPPEVWSAIQHAHSLLQMEPENLVRMLDEVLRALDAISGAVNKHMLRDSGWQFWHLGVHLERAVTTVIVMRQVVLKPGEEDPVRSEGHLDALLRMLASLYAYRSLFQSRPLLANVATMLLQDPQVPHSLLHCLDQLDITLRATFPAGASGPGSDPIRKCAHLLGDVRFLELAPFFETTGNRKSQDFPRLLASLETRLDELSTSVSDHYLYHQAVNILR